MKQKKQNYEKCQKIWRWKNFWKNMKKKTWNDEKNMKKCEKNNCSKKGGNKKSTFEKVKIQKWENERGKINKRENQGAKIKKSENEKGKIKHKNFSEKYLVHNLPQINRD